MRKKGAIRVPDTKSCAQTRVIGRAAIHLLDQPKTKSSYLFAADWGEGHVVGVVRVLDRVCEKARLADITPHTFASLAADLGFSELTKTGLIETRPTPSPNTTSTSMRR